MKVLVTGSKGVVGSKLIEVLRNKGHIVFGVDLFHTNDKYGHGLGAIHNEDYFRCDISEYRQIKENLTLFLTVLLNLVAGMVSIFMSKCGKVTP